MTEEMIEKRKLLRTLSNASIQAAEDLNLNPKEYKVNDLLMHFIYNADKTHQFNTFMGWKANGYIVKKGAKALLLWGQPLNRDRQDKTTGQIIESNEDESGSPFFPIAYLFRDDQVSKPEPRKPKQQPTQQPTQTADIDL